MGKTNIESDSVIEGKGIGRECGGDTDTTGATSGSSGSGGGKSTASRGEEKPVEVVVLGQESLVKKEAKNKPKAKPKAVTKQKEASIKSEDVQGFIKAMFATVASLPNMTHWNISDGEAKALSEPLSNILNDMMKTELPNANYVSLLIALVSILMPRLFITIQLREVNKREQSRKVKERDQGGQQTAASPDTERNAGLYASLPATS